MTETLRQTLVNLIAGGRLPHAVMLEGPSNSGKTRLALALAAAALCEAPQGEKRPCGVCAHCRKVLAGVHPDVSVFSGSGNSRGFHIDTVRSLRAQAYVVPNEAEHKVYILTDVQEMTAAAQNALLKILEEPPEHLLFVLTVTNRALLLETIVSRVVTISLVGESPQACAEMLRGGYPQAEEALLLSASILAQGSVRQAESLLESGSAAAALQLLETLGAGDEYTLLRLLPQEEKERSRQAELFSALRALAIWLLTARLRGETPAAIAVARRFSQRRLSRLVETMDEALRWADSNCNVALLSGMVCARLKEI